MEQMGEQGMYVGSGWDVARLSTGEDAFWIALWDSPIPDVLHESGADSVKFGPLHALLVTEQRHDKNINFILGAGLPGAVGHGHLADAARLMETRCFYMEDERGVDYRVPVVPGLAESAAAEEWLEEHGYVRAGGSAKLIRDGSAPAFDEPEGIEVLDWESWDDGFGGPLSESLGLSSMGETFFSCLLGDEDWRCYCGIVGDDPLAYVAMYAHEGVASIALASRPYPGRDGEGQLAVLHRCIEDARAAGCDSFVLADAGGEPPTGDRESLLRAGFEVAYRVPSWRSPVRVVAE
jgi:hypothetical protein